MKKGRSAEKPKMLDFPEVPKLTALQWVILLAVTMLSFAALLWLQGVSILLAAIVFTAVPLIVLTLLKRDVVKMLIRKPSGRAIGIGIGFGCLSMVVSFVVALGMQAGGLEGVQTNNIFGALANNPGLTIISTIIQLFGEEMITLVAFLFFLQIFRRGMAGKSSTVLAWILSSIFFGVLHYPAYHNWVHVLCVISFSRMLLTIPLLKTRNLTSSYIAHLTDDFILMGVSMAIVAAGLRTVGG